jgi:orotate phosphoribosyltransferase
VAGVVIALDRQERADGARDTAVAALRDALGVPVLSILTLQDVITFLDAGGLGGVDDPALRERIRAYQATYCLTRD